MAMMSSTRASHPRRFDRVVLMAAAVSASAALVALSILAWYHRAFTVDDAFITLRYSMNLAEGHGPTWNPGEPPIEGYTTALWMFLMALPHLVGVDALGFAKVTGFVGALGCAGSAAWLAAGLRRTASPTRRVLAASAAIVLVAGSTSMAVHAVSGMETTLFAFLLTTFFAALLEWIRRSPEGAPTTGDHKARAAVALLALAAALTRPEGNLVVGVAFGTAFLLEKARRREIALVAALGWLVPYTAYYVWRFSYYGLFAPLSFYVKAMNDSVWLRGLDEAYGFLHLLFVAQPYIGIFALVSAWSCRRTLLPVVVAALAFVFFFLVPAPIMAYERRYLFPILPALCGIAAAGAGIAADRIAAASTRWWREVDVERRSSALGVALLLAFAVLAAARIHAHASGSIAGWSAYGQGLFRAHVQLGRDLRERAPAQSAPPTVALVDVGAVAYVSGWRTIDTFGLNDAHIARTGQHDPDYVRSQDPEVVVFISQKPDVLVPVTDLDWERPIHDDFVARGYERFATYHFADDYFLLALARPSPSGSAAAR